MASSDFLVGVDLGGTKVAAAAFGPDRRMIGEIVTVPTEAARPADVTLANIERAIRDCMRGAGVAGAAPAAIGVGSTGPVDASTGRFLEATSLPNLMFFDFAGWIRDRFQAPLCLENDANCFALGEASQGAGAGHDAVVAVTLGTGFGCGIVLHGRMYSGVTGNAGEVAFCPVAGATYDEMLSGAGVKRFYERVGNAATDLTAREIGDLAEAGDARALAAWRHYGHAVGSALGTIAAVLDPSICVVGGSVAARFPLFQEPLEKRLRSLLAPAAAERLRVARAQLGPTAGVIGAAEYAWSRLGK
jgi:glucokinase